MLVTINNNRKIVMIALKITFNFLMNIPPILSHDSMDRMKIKEISKIDKGVEFIYESFCFICFCCIRYYRNGNLGRWWNHHNRFYKECQRRIELFVSCFIKI